MNILTSVENNPALILLKSTVHSLALTSPVVPQLSDSVNISDRAKQLAKAAASANS